MQAVSAAPAHELLQRKDNAGNHSTRKASHGTADAFKSYAFGPMDTKSTNPDDSGKTGLKAIQGSATLHNPLVKHSALAVTALQSVSGETGSLAAAAGVKAKP
jgi:hypothetical protein